MPMAGAPRTASVRMASATSAAEPHSRYDDLVGKEALVQYDDRLGVEADDLVRLQIRHRGTRSISGLRALVPGRQVPRLLLGEAVDLDAHALELEAGDLAIDLLGHDVDAGLELVGVRDDVLGRQGLVREAHVHDGGGMPLGGREVDEPALADQVDAAPVGELELLDLRSRLARGDGELSERRDLDLDVEVAGVREDRPVLQTLDRARAR